MGGEKIQAQPRIQIREGMTVEEVKKYGSEGQKLAACLFDETDTKDESTGHYVKDGVYSEREAARFNSYNFTVRNNIFTMYDRANNQTTEIRYSNLEDLKKFLNDDWNEPGYMSFWNKDGKQKVYMGDATHNGKITFDLTEGTVTADGVVGEYIYANGKKVTVTNSDVDKIGSHAKELEIKNTKGIPGLFSRLLGDNATLIEAGKETNVKIDDQSYVELTRDEEE